MTAHLKQHTFKYIKTRPPWRSKSSMGSSKCDDQDAPTGFRAKLGGSRMF